MDLLDFLEKLPSQVSVGVNITRLDGSQVKPNGLALISQPPAIQVVFPADELPDPEAIDTKADCLIFIESGEVVTLICSIEEPLEPDRLNLTLENYIEHDEKRDYFRGPAERLNITWVPPEGANSQEQTPARGQGINISCGGILMTTSHPIEAGQTLSIQISLPAPVNRDIACPAQILRVNRTDDDLYFAALQFTDLEPDICDDIMAFCFAEQRRLLREQVMTRDL